MRAKIPLPTDLDRADVAHAGQCSTCKYLRVLRSRRSTFVHCGRAAEDPRFPRYPPLPVQVCPGYTDSSGTDSSSAGTSTADSNSADTSTADTSTADVER